MALKLNEINLLTIIPQVLEQLFNFLDRALSRQPVLHKAKVPDAAKSANFGMFDIIEDFGGGPITYVYYPDKVSNPCAPCIQRLDGEILCCIGVHLQNHGASDTLNPQQGLLNTSPVALVNHHMHQVESVEAQSN